MENETVEKDITLYLTFRLENEVLALEVANVREVLNKCPMTRIPKAQEYLVGAVNLRGSIIPVIDLRVKFGLAKTEAKTGTRIMILELSHQGAEAEVGILTDSVHEVIGIAADQITPPQDTGERWRTEYIKGIGKYGDDFILLLDILKTVTGQAGEAVLT